MPENCLSNKARSYFISNAQVVSLMVEIETSEVYINKRKEYSNSEERNVPCVVRNSLFVVGIIDEA